MEKDIGAIKQIIETSQSAGLLLEKGMGEEFFLAKEALKTALLLKNLALISLPYEIPAYASKWLPFLTKEGAPVPQKISINIPKEKYPVKELKYDEDNDYFSLLITLQGTNFNKDDLIFKETLPKTDSIFYFCRNFDSEKLNHFKTLIEIPEKENVILIKPDQETVSEKAFEIIDSFSFDNEILKTSHLPTLLFAAVFKETDGFKNISQGALRLAARLLELGADKETAENIFNQDKIPVFWQMLGRALARTAVDQNLQSSWTFLSKKDFEKHKAEPKEEFLLKILKEISQTVPGQTFSLILWPAPTQNAFDLNNEDEIWATIKSADAVKLNFLATELKTKNQNGHLKTGPFKTFSEAEIQIRRALKSAIF